jgi:CBS domain containing-hemolysin-like protein
VIVGVVMTEPVFSLKTGFAAIVGVLVLGLTQGLGRTIGKRMVVPVARSLMPVVRFLVLVALPIVLIVEGGIWLLTRSIGSRHSKSDPYWTMDELAELSELVAADELGNPSQELLRSIIEFSDTLIREIMVPRTEMVTLPLTASPEDVRKVVLENGHSRIPVFDETIDNISGVLHVKRLFAAELEARAGGGLAELQLDVLLRTTFYVPEVMKISELLREFQRRKTHMAIVVDEYGGTAGVVTLEDIIEEIVGEIQDEYDVEERQFRQVAENKILADGRVDLDELEEVTGIQFPKDTAYETLAGFVTAQAGCLLEAGKSIVWEEITFTVKDADERRISTVEIERAERFELAERSRDVVELSVVEPLEKVS